MMEVLESRTHKQTTAEKVLEVEGLDVDIRTPKGTVRVVGNVSFTAYKGQTLALLGESGCGKSMTAKAIAGSAGPGGVRGRGKR